MPISDILKERNCGYFRINACSICDDPLDKVMESFNLAPKPEWLREIDQHGAIQVIKTILWKDLAYSGEMITEERAIERAKILFSLFYDEATRLYTNGDWADYHKKSSTGFTPLTDSTFNAGVLFISDNYAACIWVEDED